MPNLRIKARKTLKPKIEQLKLSSNRKFATLAPMFKSLYKAGESWNEISTHLNISYRTIGAWIKKLGLEKRCTIKTPRRSLLSREDVE